MIERHNKFNSRFAVGLTGVLIVFIASAALTGLVFNTPRLASWVENWVGMALPTIVCFLLAGAAFVIISLTNRFWRK